MAKHILITGAGGQLGYELEQLLNSSDKYHVTATHTAQLDITSRDSIRQFFDTHMVDVVVNCAAYTAVDKAESEPEACRLVNAQAVELLGKAAQAHGARMIHVSTDYVFDGTAHTPYQETDATCPASTYGRTKLEGEQLLQTAAPGSVIVRTSWLYSSRGKNFVKTMLRLGREKSRLTVVFDQIGTPTYAANLAQAIASIIGNERWTPGIYHYSNEGAISWYDFAKAIHRIAGITTCDVQPCKTSEYPTPASRPHYSVLDKSKIKATYGITIPYWEDSLATCLKELGECNTH